MIKAINYANEWIGKGASFLLVGIIFSVTYEVIARYIFNSPTTWSLELSSYLMAAYVMLGAGLTLLRDGHVNVNVIYSRFSFRTQAIVDCLTSPLAFAFTIVLVWYGWDIAFRAYSYGETSKSILDWPLFPSLIVVPIGAFLLLLQSIVKFIRGLRTAFTGKLLNGAKPESKSGDTKDN